MIRENSGIKIFQLVVANIYINIFYVLTIHTVLNKRIKEFIVLLPEFMVAA